MKKTEALHFLFTMDDWNAKNVHLFLKETL